jgi:pimeloyl-ACP methyl ester carboxylesterase
VPAETVLSSSFRAPSGIRLAIHDWGGDGPPVLLAHPTGFHGIVWAPVARRLVARGRRVWSFDFRGHGDSDPAPGGDYHWSGFADDARAVADHLGLSGDPALLAAGHSKGGASLLLGAIAAPGTYARIWAFEPIVFPTEVPIELAEDNPMSRGARRRRATWDSRDQAYESYASRPPLDVLTAESLRAYVDYGFRDLPDGTVTLKCLPEHEARMYAMGASNGLFGRLGEVDAPVLVACGERTDAINPALAGQVAERIPASALEVWTGRGHFGPQEDPDAAVDSMLRFAGA